MNFSRFIPFLSLLLLSSCFLSKPKSIEISVPYQLSYDLPVYGNDKYTKDFLAAIMKEGELSSAHLDSVFSIAEKATAKVRKDLPSESPEATIRLEIIHYYLLDDYLLPTYKKSGLKEMEERILTSLVQLKELGASGELLLQVEALHAISQGGFYYPELQDHYSSILHSLDHKTPESKKAHTLLTELEEKSVP